MELATFCVKFCLHSSSGGLLAKGARVITQVGYFLEKKENPRQARNNGGNGVYDHKPPDGGGEITYRGQGTVQAGLMFFSPWA